MIDLQTILKQSKTKMMENFLGYTHVETICKTIPSPQKTLPSDWKLIRYQIKIDKKRLTDYLQNIKLNDEVFKAYIEETKYLLDELTKNSKKETVKEHTKEVIDDAVTKLFENNFNPACIILPASYFEKVVNWNKGVPTSELIQHSKILYAGPNIQLKVVYIKKKSGFNDVIITSQHLNYWSFVPSDDNKRLSIEDDFEMDRIDVTISLEEKCKLNVSSNQGNITLQKK